MKLGKTQIEVLRCLRERGQWYDGCGWHWDNYSGTTKLLDSLVRRGHATKVLMKGQDENPWRPKYVYKPINKKGSAYDNPIQPRARSRAARA